MLYGLGLAYKEGICGKEGPDSHSPGGTGEDVPRFGSKRSRNRSVLEYLLMSSIANNPLRLNPFLHA